MHDYLGLFKRKKSQTSGIMHATPPTQHDTLQQIPQSELAGLVAWVQLVEVVAKNVKFLESLNFALRYILYLIFD